MRSRPERIKSLLREELAGHRLYLDCLLASHRWSWAVARVAAYQHLVPSRPGALKVQDGHAPGRFSRTAEAEGKQVEASRPAANDPFSGNIGGGFASIPLSVGFVSNGAVCGNDAALTSGSTRLSTLVRAAAGACASRNGKNSTGGISVVACRTAATSTGLSEFLTMK